MKRHPGISAFERLAMRAPRTALDLNECWLWRGSCCNKGYGHIRVGGVTKRVHIVAWEMARGRKVRKGYTLDHGCRNKACWRPSHMEEVTRAVNTARGNRANPRSTEAARLALRRRRAAVPGVPFDGHGRLVDDGHGEPDPSKAREARARQMLAEAAGKTVREIHGELTRCDGPDSYE